MKKKIIAISIVLLILGAFIANHLITYARIAEKPLYVKLSAIDLKGIGYGNGNPNPDVGGTSNQGEYIWNIMTQEGLNGPDSTTQRNLYCVKANYGQTWFTEQKDGEILEYNLTYDMQVDREELLKKLKDNENDADDVIKALLTPGEGQYEQLLWILDNSYTKPTDETKTDEEVNKYLEKIGIFSDEYEGETYYYKIEDGLEKEYPNGEPLTESDIIAIQRMAIWYFTNGENYDKTSSDLWLFLTLDGTHYDQLKTLSESRHAMAMDLYTYLIEGAKAGASQYKLENEYKVDGAPANVNTTGLKKEDNKYIVETTKNGSNYLIGPVVIEKNNDLGYDIDVIVKDQNGNKLTQNTDYMYTNKDGKVLENISSNKDLVGIDGGFYISVARSKIESVDIEVNISYKTTSKKLWLQGIEDENEIKLNAEQPLVEIKQDPQELIVKLISKSKKFDLALFKHIAAISKNQKIEDGEYITDTGKKDGTYLRAPIVKAIDTNTGKITYEQDDKAALTVEPGDYVLYTIRVYNEGEIDGYASMIKDTLPIGLEFVTENEEYNGIWKLEELDADGRQVVTTTWYAKGQGAELNSEEGDTNYKSNLLKALNKESEISNENPDYLDAQVLCRVVEKATSNRVLVNYAQISDDSDENGNPIDDVDSTPDKWIDTDDDQDVERVQLQYFDLALRKFITAVNETELKEKNGKYTREPIVNTSNLIDRKETTAVYTHTKEPLAVQIGDKIVYTIRVYNEGDINGFASKVTDYLPSYLTFVKNSEINTKYGWELSEDGRIVTTKYLADKEIEAFNGTELDYEDLKIECIVSEDAPLKENITNIAEISEYKYNGNTVSKDIDSTADNMKTKNYLPTDENLPSYKDEEISKEYVPGNEDDDDFEKVYVKIFDLALRKFITQVQDKEITTRVPQVKIENDNITYEHPKDALIVHVEDVVTYTLRIYNEGEISGYANLITDDIPEYLEYLPENSTNVEYMWKMYNENNEETTEVEKTVKVKTTYLSKENGEDNLIKAFDGTNLDYRDIKIAFKVKDPNSNTIIITNHAQISNDRDENNNPVKDRDSEPDEWNEGEDDQDIENIKVEYFDLSLLKFVTKVITIEDGKETITQTGYNGYEDPEPVVKVELHRKKLNKVTVKFGYGITITNEGDIPGYATEITDYVPEGLKFVKEDNPNWTDEGNNVISTKQLENVLLQPGESKTLEVILTWINSSDNLALKTNTAEISEDKNEYDVPDRDSIPDNKKDGEDDIDIAKVILAISTGAVKTYFTLTLGLLIIIATGVILIKKFVI